MRSSLLVVLSVFASAASAQQSIYVGIGYGSFDYKEDTGDPLIGPVADTASSTKLFGGFEINDHFTLEISYAKTADLRDTNVMDVPPFGEVTGTLATDFTITTLSALGQVPFEWGALLGGLGYFSSDSDFTVAASADCCGTLRADGSLSDDGLMAMLGIEWRFGRFGSRYALRLEYEWWDMSNIDTSTIGVGFSYGF